MKIPLPIIPPRVDSRPQMTREALWWVWLALVAGLGSATLAFVATWLCQEVRNTL